MTRFSLLTSLALLVCVNSRPLTENQNTKSLENDNSQMGQNRAGIGDLLNPQNLVNAASLNGNPLQNFTNIAASQNELLKEVRLFFLTVQGALMPANVATGGLGNFAQTFGNVFGNLNPITQ
ncbi:hypothetical protein ABEB36_007606 [Hypothenemus hampei]|uniref:Uncharacterized protein n=1 Tax=Hypothenemus hampei TaxID=57062 RepID=A0ABD1EUJ9_HYPHA